MQLKAPRNNQTQQPVMAEFGKRTRTMRIARILTATLLCLCGVRSKAAEDAYGNPRQACETS